MPSALQLATEANDRSLRTESHVAGVENRLAKAIEGFDKRLGAHAVESSSSISELAEVVRTGFASQGEQIAGIKSRTAHDDAVNEGIRQEKADQEKAAKQKEIIAADKEAKRQGRWNTFFAGWASLATVAASVTGLYIAFHHAQNLTINESTNTSVLDHPIAPHAVLGTP